MSLASRTTGGGSPEEARRVAEVDATCVGAGGASSAEGAAGVDPPTAAADAVAAAAGSAATLIAPVVAKPRPVALAAFAVELDASASPSRAGAVCADGRVNPGGVSGARPGVWGADESLAAPVGAESPPEADLADASDVEFVLAPGCPAAIEGDAVRPAAAEGREVRLDAAAVGEVDVGEEVVEGAVAAVTSAFSSGLDSLRRDDCPPPFEVPCPPAAAAPLAFEASPRCVNKPSKNAKRGWDGAICLSLSTVARALLKSSALRAASVCATRSPTSCEYCGA
jgi:hypothetical protein